MTYIINALDASNEVFKLENINLEYSVSNDIIWEDTSINGDNHDVIIPSEYLGIKDGINGYCVSSQYSQLITVPIDISPNEYPNLTIIAWVHQTHTISNNFQVIISNDNWGWDRGLYPYAIGYGGIAAGVGKQGSTQYNSTLGYLTLNTWAFISVVYTNIGSALIYKGENGSLINDEISYDNTNYGKDYFAINGVPDTQRLNHFFLGCIGQVEIYSDALSHNNIKERFEAMMRGITIIPSNSPTKYPSISPTNMSSIEKTIDSTQTTSNGTALVSTENIFTNNTSSKKFSKETMLWIIISCIGVLCIIIFSIFIYYCYINITKRYVTPKITPKTDGHGKSSNTPTIIVAKRIPLPLSVKSSNTESELANHIQSMENQQLPNPSGIKIIRPNIITPNDTAINRPSISTDNTEIILANQVEGVIDFDNEYAL